MVQCEEEDLVAHTLVRDHDVVIVAITYTQYIGGHTVTSTGLHKSLHSLVVLYSNEITAVQ